jgi:K+-sensing histidine kinase KdpD
MLAGIALTLIVTALSGRLGASWSGVLAVFPLMGVVLSVSSHRAHGPAFVIALLRGMVAGRFSFGAFCLVLSFALTREPALAAFAQAAALAICVQALTKRLAQSRASASPASNATRRNGIRTDS